MIRYLRLRAWFCLFLVSLMTFVQPLAVFADVRTSSNAFAVNPDYLIGSASNADPYGVATLDLYDVVPLASGGTVSNTVTGIPNMYVEYMNPSTGVYAYGNPEPVLSNNRFSFSFKAPTGCRITGFGISLLSSKLAANYGKKVSLPSPGNYKLSFDFSSDFAYDYSAMKLRAEKSSSNVANQDTFISLSPSFYSGDVYLSPFAVSLVNLDYLGIQFVIPIAEEVGQIGGSFAIHFDQSSSVGTSTGIETPEEDYSADISGGIESAVEELQYISTSQNLIIQGIDNVIMHISDQLYAFWDQLYNLIHLPELAVLNQIKEAVENIKLKVNINMDEVVTSVNNMSTNVQNKLQQTTDKITGGYDNSGLESENQALQDAVNEYDESEQAILDSVEGNIEGFEYPAFENLPLGTLAALSFFGGFMQSIFEGMGAFNMIITFGLTLVFVLILIGYHRIRN